MHAPAHIADFLLRFTDESSSFAVALALNAVTTTEDGPQLVRFTNSYAILVIGLVDAAPGWWVRLRVLDDTPLPEAVLPFVVPEADAEGLNLPVWA